MKILIAYISQTVNTKKVAEAIYSAIPEPKEIKRLEDVKSLESYDLSFLGFPIHASGPDKKAKTFLERYTKDRSIALFITHMSPEYAKELPGWIQKFRDAAVGANCLGVFDCQGQGSALIKFIMRIAPNPQIRKFAKLDNSRGQPDSARLERAKIFANEIMNKISSP